MPRNTADESICFWGPLAAVGVSSVFSDAHEGCNQLIAKCGDRHDAVQQGVWRLANYSPQPRRPVSYPSVPLPTPSSPPPPLPSPTSNTNPPPSAHAHTMAHTIPKVQTPLRRRASAGSPVGSDTETNTTAADTEPSSTTNSEFPSRSCCFFTDKCRPGGPHERDDAPRTSELPPAARTVH